MTKKSLGICVGASTVSFVFTEEAGNDVKVISTKSVVHEGNPKKILLDFFENTDTSNLSVVITGRKFKQLVNGYTISEPEAIEYSVNYLNLKGKYRCIASLGGENFIVYCLNEDGNLDKVLTGNKCASGTGEFFLQQIRRMNLTIDEALELSNNEKPYHVSGRCSVFCKSDCTHALNKGIEKGFVVSGLSKMIADKTIELLTKQESRKVLIIGGVSQNRSVIEFIKEKYPQSYIPNEAVYFEALGASLIGLEKFHPADKNNLFKSDSSNFTTLEHLKSSEGKVTFKNMPRGNARENDICLLGLDVGSTTTKAVIIRYEDNALLASIYLRTNGNPVQASIDCYKALNDQVKTKIKIVGLGTTGSGRYIAALHALTKGVVNEIISHAVASSYFDKEVNTIFEIGGQDAKYTHLTNGIASDYAMNEACSAGTGSFLEESAKETLNIDYKEIGNIAFSADEPLNFNDQCAAFISSDIKTASHEGKSKENIVAGLVYSICMNYVNRVKGNRPVGKKVFMQGGVCYNKAVPYAMANLVNKEIIVPPEPGLMGAFGVALEIKNKIELGFLEKENFNLESLIEREFKYEKEFSCAGGKEKCDLKCAISIIEVEGKRYPFGGACNKYYNERNHIKIGNDAVDYVKLRQELVFKKYVSDSNLIDSRSCGNDITQKTIGISKSFQTNTIYPLYYNFFTKLGFKVVLSELIEKEGIDKIRSSFCYPVEIAHGYFQDLLNKKVDYIFLPHITQMETPDKHAYKRLCVFVQGENYYLRTTFKNEKLPKLLTPIIDLSKNKEGIQQIFIKIAKQLGKTKKEGKEAFQYADAHQKAMLEEFKEIGTKALEELKKNPNKFGMVLFGRSYNAFAGEANLNIPHKFSSKNLMIIPHDFLTSENMDSYNNMYWYSGQQILKSARFVKEHEQLFGVFITNFSCGPDSFIISFFRNIMGNKPSLTLELDSHSADVGIDTRIDAAIDIIKNYLELNKKGRLKYSEEILENLKIVYEDNRITIIDKNKKKFQLSSEDVEILIPSMGKFSTEAFSAICRSFGINSHPLPIPTFKTLQQGRGLTTCKECLPFILTTGSLSEYVERNHIGKKNILFFMPHGYGPCRQGQYYILLNDIIKKLKLKNVGVLSMDDEASFDNLGHKFFIMGWLAIIIADIVHDIENVLTTLAKNHNQAAEVLNNEWVKIIRKLEKSNKKEIYGALTIFA
jgi:predicted CoA-substrate-specific enzyme activase